MFVRFFVLRMHVKAKRSRCTCRLLARRSLARVDVQSNRPSSVLSFGEHQLFEPPNRKKIGKEERVSESLERVVLVEREKGRLDSLVFTSQLASFNLEFLNATVEIRDGSSQVDGFGFLFGCARSKNDGKRVSERKKEREKRNETKTRRKRTSKPRTGFRIPPPLILLYIIDIPTSSTSTSPLIWIHLLYRSRRTTTPRFPRSRWIPSCTRSRSPSRWSRSSPSS